MASSLRNMTSKLTEELRARKIEKLIHGIRLSEAKCSPGTSEASQKNVVKLVLSEKTCLLAILNSNLTKEDTSFCPMVVREVVLEKTWDGTTMITLKTGFKFVLTDYAFLTKSQDDAIAVKKEIEKLKEVMEIFFYNKKIELFLQRQFEAATANPKTKGETLDNFMKLISGGMNFKSYSDGKLDFSEFCKYYRKTLNQLHSNAISTWFYESGKGKEKRLGRMCLSSFINFVKLNQRDEMARNEALDTIDGVKTRLSTERQSMEEPHLSFEDFLDYLYSPINQICNPDKIKGQYQPMNQPLSFYFINSSHNTYLTGNQWASDSSSDAYTRVLQLGARCIELDCWDGTDGKPIITHGRTVCSKIKLQDALNSIKKNAFVYSPYPLILSIEDHCSVPQQTIMAQMMKDTFGDLLLKKTVESDYSEFLPSPEELKYKILIKHKLSAGEKSKAEDSPEPEDEYELPEDASKESGLLFQGKLQLKLDRVWDWVESNAKLFEDRLEFLVQKQEVPKDISRSSSLSDESRNEDFRVLGINREETEEIFRLDPTLEEGTYALREKSANPNDLVLSLLQGNRLRHVPISRTPDHSLVKIGDLSFNSLKDMLDYFKTCPVILKNKTTGKLEEVYLKNALNENNLHKVQNWYFPNLQENDTNRLLASTETEGSFLLREETSSKQVILSFLSSDGVVNHAYITSCQSCFMIKGLKKCLRTIHQLVKYYHSHPIINNECLTVPITIALKLHEDNTEKRVNIKSRFLSGTDFGEQDSVEKAKDAEKTEAFGLNEVCSKYDSLALDVKDLTLTAEVLRTPVCRQGISCLKLVDSNNKPIYINCYDNEVLWRCWAIKLQEAIAKQKRKEYDTGKEKSDLKFAPELTDLAIYCKAVRFNESKLRKTYEFQTDDNFDEMSSFSESKGRETMIEDGNIMAFQWRHKKNLCRIYPKGTRTDSSNYNPIPYWLCGAQMAALNFQTSDKEFQINQGWFVNNGNCGYVLKPRYMTEGCFDPIKPTQRDESINLKLSVISGRHLQKSFKNFTTGNIFVKLETFGCDLDCKIGTTAVVQNNAFSPWWDESFDFGVILNPSLTVLRICAFNQKGSTAKNELLGQQCLPLSCLRQGIRSVTLKNSFGELENPLAVILVHVDFSPVETNSNLLKKLISNCGKETEEGQRSDAIKTLTEIMAQKTLPQKNSDFYSSSTHNGIPRKIQSTKFFFQS